MFERLEAERGMVMLQNASQEASLATERGASWDTKISFISKRSLSSRRDLFDF
jgi:hypothetical protein